MVCDGGGIVAQNNLIGISSFGPKVDSPSGSSSGLNVLYLSFLKWQQGVSREVVSPGRKSIRPMFICHSLSLKKLKSVNDSACTCGSTTFFSENFTQNIYQRST